MKLDTRINEQYTLTFNKNEIVEALAEKISATGIAVDNFRVEVRAGDKPLTNIEIILSNEEISGKDFNHG